MTFGSVCSGIEAASVAWLPLNWKCAFTAEIEPFPCAVLKHHYPDTLNYGDITRFREWPATPIDVLIGGTPCQSFSVAGLRKGLADPRGNLALTFLAIVERFSPTWFCWENVPGVLSIDEGKAFGSFLGGVAELGYGFAYGVLDAQYFGLAQRRKRVFVVGHIGGQWQRAAAVLFDRESLCGNPPPRRQTREGTAPTISARANGGGGLGTDAECDGAVIPIQEIGKRQSGTPMNGVGRGQPGDPMYTLQSNVQHGIASTLRACSSTERGHNGKGGTDENLIAHALKADGFDASEDGTGRGTPLIAAPIHGDPREHKGGSNPTDGHFVVEQNNVASTPEKPSMRAQEFPNYAVFVPEIVPQAMSSKWSKGSSGPSGDETANMIPVSLHENQRGELTTSDTAGSLKNGGGKPGQGYPAVAFTQGNLSRGEGPRPSNEVAPTFQSQAGDQHPCVATAYAVRRLTPKECCRLQGFPDDYLDILYRNKPAADGTKYKALGNSMAVPVIRWLGEQIQAVHELQTLNPTP